MTHNRDAADIGEGQNRFGPLIGWYRCRLGPDARQGQLSGRLTDMRNIKDALDLWVSGRQPGASPLMREMTTMLPPTREKRT